MPHRTLAFAKRMRRTPTEAEARLWRHLRAHRFCDYKFRRQQPMGAYIIDFVCFQQAVIVEVDGSQHVDDAANDAARTAWLQSQGFRVLRFWNHDVLARTREVLDAIHAALQSGPSPGFAARNHPLP